MRVEKMKLKPICSRKGISLVEVVVTLTVITIVSIATLSLVIASAKVDAKSLRNTQVMMAAENALECFRFSEDEDEFGEMLAKTGDYSDVEGAYILRAQSYTITVNADYSVKKLTFTAFDTNGEVIYTYGFNKGQ